MLKFLKVVLCVLFCLSFLNPGFSAGLCDKVNLTTLKTHIPFTLPKESQIVAKREIKGLCEVILKIKNRSLPLYVGNDFVILGQMFSYKRNVAQSQIKEIQTKTFTDLKPQIEEMAVIVYKPSPTATHVVYMFTDPLCPWCHKAEEEIKQVVDKYNVTLKIIFYPVHLPKGKERAIEAVCRKLDLDTYLRGDWKKENKTKEYQCKEGKQLLENSMSLGKKLGVSGVPTFFLDNGNKVVGANITKLQMALAKLTGKNFQKVKPPKIKLVPESKRH